MNTIKHVLLKGNESFLDHTKSIALYGKLYWRKSNKKLNVGDIVYLFMSGKGHYQIRYKLEVTNTSVPRQDEKCWLAPFVPDNDCFEFTPVAAMYEGEELGLNELETIGISRYVQYAVLNNEQINFIDKYFEQHYSMIGAIIGDLAAWTWENDHEKFYTSLISEKALLSEFGLSVLATADALDFNLFMNEAEYKEYIRSWFRVVNDDVVCYSEGVKEWIEKQDYNYNTWSQELHQ